MGRFTLALSTFILTRELRFHRARSPALHLTWIILALGKAVKSFPMAGAAQ